jgi:hypothetical protein
MAANILGHNVGATDRVIRIVLGVALLALAFVGPQTAWGYLGLIPLATGVIGTCPLYTVLGVSTCAASRQKAA